MEGNTWSVLRRAVQRGYDLAYHRATGTDYETLSAQMDGVARDLESLIPVPVPRSVNRSEDAKLYATLGELDADLRKYDSHHTNAEWGAKALFERELIPRLRATARAGLEDRERREAFARARIGLTVPELGGVLQIATSRGVDVDIVFAVHQMLARMAQEGMITINPRGVRSTPSDEGPRT